MPTSNESYNTTAQLRDVWFINFPFDGPGKSHPGSVLGFENGLVKVCSGTSKTWHEGDNSFVRVERGGMAGLSKTTYFQTSETCLVSLESLKFKTGSMNDSDWDLITGKIASGTHANTSLSKDALKAL